MIIALLVAGCATTPKSIESFEVMKAQKGVVSVPYTRNEHGLFIIDVELLGTQASFLLDTGATRTSMFADFFDKHANSMTIMREVNVHGLINSGMRPLVEIPVMKMGTAQYDNLLVAILPERTAEETQTNFVNLSGLIGMDVLRDFSLFIEPGTSTIQFVPKNLPRPPLSNKWEQVVLYPNPFSEQDRDLHFFDLRVGNILIPAILDSGAEFSVMNWHVTQIPQINRLKKRLRKEWELQGALEEFDPAIKIDVHDMRAGSKFWSKNEFIVMDFDHLDILGVHDKPLIIAGAKIFEDKRVFLDFQENTIWFEAGTKEKHFGFRYGLTIHNPVWPSTPDGPEARN